MGLQSQSGRLTRRERVLYAALHRIANIGSDNPNRIYIRAFHHTTIEIAEHALQEANLIAQHSGPSGEQEVVQFSLDGLTPE